MFTRQNYAEFLKMVTKSIFKDEKTEKKSSQPILVEIDALRLVRMKNYWETHDYMCLFQIHV